MSDLRENLFIKNHSILEDADGYRIAALNQEAAFNAMDEYFTERALELLEYMAKNNVDCLHGGIHNPENKRHFYFKKEWITAEQLFENFL